MQRLLSCRAEREPEHRFDHLFNLVCSLEWLRLAHDHVAQNAGSVTAGCDGITMADFDANLEKNLRELHEALKSGTFEAQPVRRVYIPKAKGKVRPLGISSIKDRVVQEAIRMALEPIYEADFCQDSHGFRPNRCTMDAATRLWMATREGLKNFWAIEGDISAYFDTIKHRKLNKLLCRRLGDGRLLDLIWKFLRAGVMEGKLFKDTKLGAPQGGIVSPLLANVYLHELDRYMERNYTGLPTSQKCRRRRTHKANLVYVRYADDFVILCNGTKEQAYAVREEVGNFLATELRLTLSMEKTKVTHLNDGFDFLGFNFRRRMGQHGMSTRLSISAKALRAHLEKIKAITSPSSLNDSVAAKFAALNRAIGGWCRYFQHTHCLSRQLGALANRTFWLTAHWLGAKEKVSIPEVMRRYRKGHSLGTADSLIKDHTYFTRMVRYAKSIRKPNPYTTMSEIEREELLDACPWWRGNERRPGQMDLKLAALKRDDHRCRFCKKSVTAETSQLHHVRPYSHFKRPVEANTVGNTMTLCIDCHERKTELDRERESRMR
jgi:group II intron reverse transcriptase/maturase